jgi:hypothetical protein
VPNKKIGAGTSAFKVTVPNGYKGIYSLKKGDSAQYASSLRVFLKIPEIFFKYGKYVLNIGKFLALLISIHEYYRRS